jgi:hypothetical protein
MKGPTFKKDKAKPIARMRLKKPANQTGRRSARLPTGDEAFASNHRPKAAHIKKDKAKPISRMRLKRQAQTDRLSEGKVPANLHQKSDRGAHPTPPLSLLFTAQNPYYSTIGSCPEDA